MGPLTKHHLIACLLVGDAVKQWLSKLLCCRDGQLLPALSACASSSLTTAGADHTPSSLVGLALPAATRRHQPAMARELASLLTDCRQSVEEHPGCGWCVREAVCKLHVSRAKSSIILPAVGTSVVKAPGPSSSLRVPKLPDTLPGWSSCYPGH
jgi:hypothetical protein